jgi:hypothetical protein
MKNKGKIIPWVSETKGGKEAVCEHEYEDAVPNPLDVTLKCKKCGDIVIGDLDARQPEQELVEALEGLMYSVDHIIDCIGNQEMSLKVASGIIDAVEVLAKHKEKE